LRLEIQGFPLFIRDSDFEIMVHKVFLDSDFEIMVFLLLYPNRPKETK